MTDEPERARRFTWDDPKASARIGLAMAGIDYLRAMFEGRMPPPPIMRLMDVTIGEIAPGRVSMRLLPQEFHYNPLGVVHGGVAATLLDSVMGCAVHSQLPAGRGYTTLEIKVNYLRAMTDAVGEVHAVGTTVHVGRRSAVAEGRITDAQGRIYATASTTCLVFDLSAGPA